MSHSATKIKAFFQLFTSKMMGFINMKQRNFPIIVYVLQHYKYLISPTAKKYGSNKLMYE